MSDSDQVRQYSSSSDSHDAPIAMDAVGSPLGSPTADRHAVRGTEPTIALLRRLAAALDADVRLTAGHDLGSMWFEPHAA
jgi:hypothetical protein